MSSKDFRTSIVKLCDFGLAKLMDDYELT
jgi:serine/threonine protein kinase